MRSRWWMGRGGWGDATRDRDAEGMERMEGPDVSVVKQMGGEVEDIGSRRGLTQMSDNIYIYIYIYVYIYIWRYCRSDQTQRGMSRDSCSRVPMCGEGDREGEGTGKRMARWIG